MTLEETFVRLANHFHEVPVALRELVVRNGEYLRTYVHTNNIPPSTVNRAQEFSVSHPVSSYTNGPSWEKLAVASRSVHRDRIVRGDWVRVSLTDISIQRLDISLPKVAKIEVPFGSSPWLVNSCLSSSREVTHDCVVENITVAYPPPDRTVVSIRRQVPNSNFSCFMFPCQYPLCSHVVKGGNNFCSSHGQQLKNLQPSIAKWRHLLFYRLRSMPDFSPEELLVSKVVRDLMYAQLLGFWESLPPLLVESVSRAERLEMSTKDLSPEEELELFRALSEKFHKPKDNQLVRRQIDLD